MNVFSYDRIVGHTLLSDVPLCRGTDSIIREVAKIAGGNGGKPNLAMAGGKDVTKADEALYAVKGIVEAALK